MGVDDHAELFDAMLAFVKLTLLFHSGRPWDFDSRKEWAKHSEVILALHNDKAEALKLGDKFDVTTKRLCDLGRAILG